jgi:hypothetical protein
MLRRLTFIIPSGFLLASFVCILALTRCGFPLCIAGVGLHGQSDCGETVTPVSTVGTGQFTVTATPTTISVGYQTIQVTASGGQYGPYTYTIDPTSNPSTGQYAGQVNSATGVYNPPTSLVGSGVTTESIIIRATDTTNAFKTVTITVTSG